MLVLLCSGGLLLLNAFWGLDPLGLHDGFVELSESYRAGRMWPWCFWWIFELVLTGTDSTGHWSAPCIHRPGSVQFLAQPCHGAALSRSAEQLGGCLCQLSPGLSCAERCVVVCNTPLGTSQNHPGGCTAVPWADPQSHSSSSGNSVGKME